MLRVSDRPRALALLSGSAATLAGLGYLASTGAPAMMLAGNAAALTLSLALCLALRPPSVDGRWVLAGGVVLLATALLGLSVEGAARWVRLGGVVVQPSLILLPAMVVLHLAVPSRVSSVGVTLAAVALAMQPDRAMAAALFAALLAAPTRAGAMPIATAALSTAITVIRPDLLPAMPWVDGVLFSAPRAGFVPGVAVWSGITVALLPALLALRTAGSALRGFGACWIVIVVASALGNYPTPLVGFGASAIMGYLLGAGWLPRTSAAPTGSTASRPPRRINGHRLPRIA